MGKVRKNSCDKFSLLQTSPVPTVTLFTREEIHLISDVMFLKIFLFGCWKPWVLNR